ncbi:deoxyguanosinetriphosphate triphosphohydrolase [Ornithinimicrobium pratense]|uniref:Deoxyguanosinetriphosphate triphosphohydrolase n=1 Tax=Ornithinimicrobium pratense TaxID=2593973 RepID=A0A5J6V8S9_9MICO|nr:deoxyguanosinetriphosphate triphosphohydrolase [Ornithinimicrobium pratense]
MGGARVRGYAPADRERWVAEDPAQKRSDRHDFARDRARVLHSAALRRLAATTQVVAPTSDDFVRNRLTHSLEVAQIGREFGAALGCDADVVDAACLAHDIGHPPFGHNGEVVLDELSADIGGFEGNAQTLRVLTRLEAKRVHADGRPAGLNLTRASLDAAMKYPWVRGEGSDETAAGKFGVYADDVEVFRWVREGVPAEAPHRLCLEAQVMDWSDDVAYCVHDVEDAIASGRVAPKALRDSGIQQQVALLAHDWYAPDLPVDELRGALASVLDSGVVPMQHTGTRADLAALKDMTSRLIGHFVHTVELASRERYGPGVLTRYAADLVVPDRIRAQAAMLKAVAAHFVMLSEERRAVMDHEREVITELVRRYLADPRLLDPVHREAWDAAERSSDDAAARRAVIDQVASFSDVRALAIFARTTPGTA